MTPRRATKAQIEAPSAAVSRAWSLAVEDGGEEEAVS